MKLVSYLVFIFLVFVGLSFAFLNPTNVAVDYYFSTLELPLSVFLVLSIILGILIGSFFTLFVYIRQGRKLYSLRAQLRVANKEIDNLRDIPIKDTH